MPSSAVSASFARRCVSSPRRLRPRIRHRVRAYTWQLHLLDYSGALFRLGLSTSHPPRCFSLHQYRSAAAAAVSCCPDDKRTGAQRVRRSAFVHMSPSHTVRPARPLCRVAHTAAASAPLAGRGRLLGLSAHTWLHSAQTSQAWCNGGYKETYSPAPALPVASTFSLRHLRKTGHFLGCLPQLWTVEGERGLLSWNRSYHRGTRPTTAERGRGPILFSERATPYHSVANPTRGAPPYHSQRCGSATLW